MNSIERSRSAVETDSETNLKRILTDNALARFGDSLLNFAFSLALTETAGHPTGTRVPDRILAEAAAKAGLRAHLPRRSSRGDVANSIEALLGFVWLRRLITLDEMRDCLRKEGLTPSENFAQLATLALSRIEHR